MPNHTKSNAFKAQALASITTGLLVERKLPFSGAGWWILVELIYFVEGEERQGKSKRNIVK